MVIKNFNISDDGSHAVLSIPLEKSENDDRSYKLITLINELEVLLIHDAKTDKSSAALDVHAGSLSDPKNLQGLAHYCEHMLFMGTEKYPKENDYSEYLSKHNGFSNAYTSDDHTNYYFEVGPEFFEGALDRFSHFFITPLLNPSSVDREIYAVDSENKKNLQLDCWRVHQLEKSLSNPNHPYSHFGTGNLETLKENPIKEGLVIRDELLKFHDRYYSANIMKLVVLGKESLDQLTEWVVDKFSAVRNKNISVPTFGNDVLTEKELKRQFFVKPVKDIRTLNMKFPFPDLRSHFRVKPENYLSHLIGHEGPGSILALLKKRGWANYLWAGYHGDIGFGFFEIEIDLTESGLANYEDVVVHVFQYIEMLRQNGPQEWLFEEVKKTREISFRFKEKISPSIYTCILANIMQYPYPREWILSNSLIREFDSLLINELIELFQPDKFVLGLCSQSFTGLDRKEKWYGTEYRLEPLSDKLIQALKNIETHPELKLPTPNEFIPRNFETNKMIVSTPVKSPDMIKNTQINRIWYKKDDTFWVPKANIFMKLNSPIIATTPSNIVKTKIYAELIIDALNEYLYYAKIVGLYYRLYLKEDSLILSVHGYNDKLPILLEKVATKMKDLKVDPERFVIIKERIQRSFKNSLLDLPYQQSKYYLDYLTYDKIWTNEEKLEALENIKYEDIDAFYPELLSHLFIESLVHGSILKDDVIKIVQKVEEILQPKALLPSQLIGLRAIMIPKGKRFVYQKDVFDKDNVNSAIEYYIQVGDHKNKELRAKTSLVSQIASEPSFDQLRTKEQLGYIVFSMPRRQIGALGFSIKIQSIKDSVHLENRIENFLNKLQTIIEEMSEQEYQKQVQSIIDEKLEKCKNLYEESYRYWSQITSGYYDFEQVYADAEEIRKITKQDLLEFYKKFISPSSLVHRKLSIHLRSQKADKSNPNAIIENEEKEDNKEKKEHEEKKEELELELNLKDYNKIIDDMVKWKSHMKLGPTPVPVIDIISKSNDN